jgi:hypothetical protein
MKDNDINYQTRPAHYKYHLNKLLDSYAQTKVERWQCNFAVLSGKFATLKAHLYCFQSQEIAAFELAISLPYSPISMHRRAQFFIAYFPPPIS